MVYVEQLPSPALRRWVQSLWYCRAPKIPRGHERVLPNGCIQIILNLSRDYLTDYSDHVPPTSKTPSPIARMVLRHCLSASVDRRPAFRLDDHVPRINFMKCSIFFVTRARSGPRFCCKQLPQKNVTMRSARESLSPASPRATVRLAISSWWAFVMFAIMIRRALGGRSANSRMEFTEKHPFCPQLP